MNYELAKKLKDAGFTGVKLCHCKGGEAPEGPYHNNIMIDGKIVMCSGVWSSPTLSELIDACGDKIHGINRMVSNGKPSGWVAQYEKTGEFGSTPLEAVANLWLALQVKE